MKSLLVFVVLFSLLTISCASFPERKEDQASYHLDLALSEYENGNIDSWFKQLNNAISLQTGAIKVRDVFLTKPEVKQRYIRFLKERIDNVSEWAEIKNQYHTGLSDILDIINDEKLFDDPLVFDLITELNNNIAAKHIVPLRSQQLIVTVYDEFKDETVTSYKSKDLTGVNKALRIIWQINTPGKEKVNDRSKVLGAIWTEGSTWAYLKCDELIFLVDRERYFPKYIGHDGLVVPGSYHSSTSVAEVVNYSLSFEWARRFVSAKSVRGRICWNEFQVSEEDKSALKTMIER